MLKRLQKGYPEIINDPYLTRSIERHGREYVREAFESEPISYRRMSKKTNDIAVGLPVKRSESIARPHHLSDYAKQLRAADPQGYAIVDRIKKQWGIK